VDECAKVLAEIRQTDDRRILAPHLLDYSVLQWWSSAYRDAYRNTIESLAILREEGAETPYLSTAYCQSEITLPWGLLLLGEWGEALREVRTRITMLENNGDDRRTQAMRLYLAEVGGFESPILHQYNQYVARIFGLSYLKSNLYNVALMSQEN